MSTIMIDRRKAQLILR